MNRTPIEWTTFSANPLKYRDAEGRVVWGCVHASPGCIHCYSETLAKRYGRGGPFAAQVMSKLTPFLDDAELRHMRMAKTIGGIPVAGSRCFVGDMTDLFGDWVPDDLLNRLFSEVLEHRQDVTWQLLTKRADRLREYLSWRWGEGRIPCRNIHVGVSVEDQANADRRIPLLLQTPAFVRWVSYEPALGPANFQRWLAVRRSTGMAEWVKDGERNLLDWIVVGGESGPGSRPFDVAWARSTVEQCRAAGVPVFVKQVGSHPSFRLEDEERRGNPMPSFHHSHGELFCKRLDDRKGGDPAEWPTEIRVREFPR